MNSVAAATIWTESHLLAAVSNKSNKPFASKVRQNWKAEAPDAAAVIQQPFTPLIARPLTHRRLIKTDRSRERRATSRVDGAKKNTLQDKGKTPPLQQWDKKKT